jgi:predicted nucleic acid-binding protein
LPTKVLLLSCSCSDFSLVAASTKTCSTWLARSSSTKTMIPDQSGRLDMMLIDTSILVHVLRDQTGGNADRLLATIGDEDFALTRMIELELLAGARDERDWRALSDYMRLKTMIELRPDTWAQAGRVYFELRRNGRTVRKLLDCCIAQVAIENGLVLVHDDRDFEAIATIRPLTHKRIDLTKASQ